MKPAYPAYNLVKKIKEKGTRGTLNAATNRINRYFHLMLIYPSLKRLLHQTVMKCEDLSIEEIRQRTLDYIETMRIKNTSYGQYRYAKSQKTPVLYASLYAVLTRHLYKDRDDLTGIQRKEWIDYIQSFQDNDGLFKDPAVENDIAANSDWWGWRHLTLHTLMGLTALGVVAKKRFKIVEPFRDVYYTIKWLESRDWVIDPATTSNEIQNYFTMLQYARDFQGEDWADKTLSKGYEWLDEKQDPKTGLWGARFDSPIALSNGVQTGYHIWLMYFYDSRPIQYVERIIGSCLRTQNQFGGCVSQRYEAFQYGHPAILAEREESSMFPTWFRSLALAYLSRAIGGNRIAFPAYRFLSASGHQFCSNHQWRMSNNTRNQSNM